MPDCPKCGDPRAYIGFLFDTVECPDPTCDNFSDKLARELRVRKETDPALRIPPNED